MPSRLDPRGARGARALGIAGAVMLVVAACSDDKSSPVTGPSADGGGGGVTDDGSTGMPGDETGVPPDPGAACGVAGAAPGVSTQSIMSGGSKRTYQLFLPPTYDGHKSFPLVFVFHGDGGSGANIRGAFGLEAASAGGAVLVYPDGEGTTWQIDGAAGVAKDIAFIDDLAADLVKTHCGVASRIFAVGFSKGAYFVDQYACLGKTRLAGVVAHSGGGPFGVVGLATKYDNNGNLVCPRAPIPAMQIIGGNDDVGEAQKARDYWQRVNGCKTTSAATAPMPCVTYDGCTAGLPEIYCEVPGLGHQIWMSAPQAVWSFVTAH
jgi:polyhydroxybutyrate depolymerase